MEYVELEDRRQREPLRQRRYMDDEAPREPYRTGYQEREPEDAWSNPAEQGRFQEREPLRREFERQREIEGGREPLTGPSRRDPGNGFASPGRSWDRQGDGRSWDQDDERRPRERDRDPESRPREREPEGRAWDQPPEGRSLDRQEEEERRRPRGEEPPPSRRVDPSRGLEPVDVEPEILDDPW